MSTRQVRSLELTAIDLVGATAALVPSLVALVFPFLIAPRFAAMFQDFGGPLPRLTLLALQPVTPILLGLVPVALVVVAAVHSEGSLALRRTLIAFAFLFGLGACIALFVAMYLPIFAIAGSIK